MVSTISVFYYTLMFINPARLFHDFQNFEWFVQGWMICNYDAECILTTLNDLYTPSKHTNVETALIVNTHQPCFNVDIWLKMKVEPTYIYRRCFNVDKTTLKQPWKNYVDSMLMIQCCFNVDIWFKRKVEPTYVLQCWENSIETTLPIFVVLMFTRKWLNNKTKLSFQV